jgi:hypothetical protein
MALINDNSIRKLNTQSMLIVLGRVQFDIQHFIDHYNDEQAYWSGFEHTFSRSAEGLLSDLRRLYDAVPEKPTWLTASDLERYTKILEGLGMQTLDIDKLTEGLYAVMSTHPEAACMKFGMLPARPMEFFEKELKARLQGDPDGEHKAQDIIRQVSANLLRKAGCVA